MTKKENKNLINWCGVICKVDTSSRYENNRQALILVNAETGEYVMVASVNIPDVELELNEIAIKNYSENAGIFELLIKEEIISDTGKRVSSGFVTCPIVKLIKS